MEIKLPSTLNAVYVEGEKYERGAVELRFGGTKIGEISVTDKQDQWLSSPDTEEAQRDLDEVVAAWLREKWGMS